MCRLRRPRIRPKDVKYLRALAIGKRRFESMSYEEACQLPEAEVHEVLVRGEVHELEVVVLARKEEYVHLGLDVTGARLFPYGTTIMIYRQ